MEPSNTRDLSWAEIDPEHNGCDPTVLSLRNQKIEVRILQSGRVHALTHRSPTIMLHISECDPSTTMDIQVTKEKERVKDVYKIGAGAIA